MAIVERPPYDPCKSIFVSIRIFLRIVLVRYISTGYLGDIINIIIISISKHYFYFIVLINIITCFFIFSNVTKKVRKVLHDNSQRVKCLKLRTALKESYTGREGIIKKNKLGLSCAKRSTA